MRDDYGTYERVVSEKSLLSRHIVLQSLGGRVEVKVPRQGFILVQPRTPEEERLRQCWASSDRPERFIVPYTYVEACKIAGMQLKQIFLESGQPIPMHIHPSIANPNARSALASRILVSQLQSPGYSTILNRLFLSTLVGTLMHPCKLHTLSLRTRIQRFFNTLSRRTKTHLTSTSNRIYGSKNV